jgi:hypothetical protein
MQLRLSSLLTGKNRYCPLIELGVKAKPYEHPVVWPAKKFIIAFAACLQHQNPLLDEPTHGSDIVETQFRKLIAS